MDNQYQSLLVKFILEKNEIIKKYTGTVIVDKRDIKELKTWNEAVCQDIMFRLHWRMDEEYCPWCINPEIKHCTDCLYGKGHGICKWPNSRYQKIRSLIAPEYFLLISIPEINQLIHKYKKRAKKECSNEKRS